jgi:hypothetical protein
MVKVLIMMSAALDRLVVTTVCKKRKENSTLTNLERNSTDIDNLTLS